MMTIDVQVYVRFPAVIKQLETLYSMKLTDESGNLDRAKLRGAVFGDDDDSKRRREQLDATVWPRIQDLANEEIAQYCAGKSSCIVLVEAALLLEAAWYTWCDVVVVVTCDDEIRLSRLMERNKIDRDEAYKRLAMSGQLSQGEKLNMLGCTLGIRHDHVYTYSDDNGHDIIIDRRCKPSAAVVMDNSGTSDQLRNRAELLMKDLITEIERND